MKKIGIVGTRRRDSQEAYSKVEQKFLEIYEEGDWLVSGGCPKGGDRFAEIIAKKFGVPIIIFYPDWKRYGRGAGIVRNTDIAKESDVIIACLARTPGGADDTVEKFEQLKEGKVSRL